MSGMGITYEPGDTEDFCVMLMNGKRGHGAYGIPMMTCRMDRKALVAFTEQILTVLHEQEVHEARLLDALSMPGEGHD